MIVLRSAFLPLSSAAGIDTIEPALLSWRRGASFGRARAPNCEDRRVPEPTRAACVIGWPVEHSRSPLIHNYWIKQHGLDAEYRREAVTPEDFADFVGRLAQRGYIGANVTVPHKEAALAASTPDRLALAVGAANTLWLDGGTLRATNTDVDGFLANPDA